MSRLLWLSLGLVLGLGAATFATGLASHGWLSAPPEDEGADERRRAGPGMPIQDFITHHRAALGVEASTFEQVWQIADAAKDELDGYRADEGIERAALAKVLQNDAVDTDAVERHVTQMGALQTKRRLRELQVMLSIRALLSVEQRAELLHLRLMTAQRPTPDSE